MRPRFKVEVPLPPEVILARFKRMLEDPPSMIRGNIRSNHLTLDVVDAEVHYWSPQVNFRVESNLSTPEGSVVSGLIGPRPNVWTLYMFIYFSLGTLGFIIGSFGISKALLGSYSNLLLAFPIAVVFMLTAYLTSKKGERLAGDQTEVLKDFIREGLSSKS